MVWILDIGFERENVDSTGYVISDVIMSKTDATEGSL